MPSLLSIRPADDADFTKKQRRGEAQPNLFSFVRDDQPSDCEIGVICGSATFKNRTLMDHIILETRVVPEWVDYNGHMNDAEYARVFSYAVDAFWEAIGLDETARNTTGVTTFTLESHICYLAECPEAETLTVKIAILDRDAKRFHLFFALYRVDGTLAATSEQMLMAIDRGTHRPTAFPDAVASAADRYGQRDQSDWPPQAGRTIGIRRR